MLLVAILKGTMMMTTNSPCWNVRLNVVMEAAVTHRSLLCHKMQSLCLPQQVI